MRIPSGLCAPVNAQCTHGWGHAPRNCPTCSERKRLIRLMAATLRWAACGGPGVKLERAQGELMAAMAPFEAQAKRKVTR